jgi:hypothetical protein
VEKGKCYKKIGMSKWAPDDLVGHIFFVPVRTFVYVWAPGYVGVTDFFCQKI